MYLSLEGIAKLPAPEKSMILSQFAGVAERPELRRQGHTRDSFLRSAKLATNLTLRKGLKTVSLKNI